MTRNYYDLLGVGADATSEGIRRAQRRFAAFAHPDRHDQNPQAVELLKVVNQAAEVLLDPEKRALLRRVRRGSVRP